jgi:hypothetical protein
MWASTFLHQDFAVKILKGKKSLKDARILNGRRGNDLNVRKDSSVPVTY